MAKTFRTTLAYNKIQKDDNDTSLTTINRFKRDFLLLKEGLAEMHIARELNGLAAHPC